MAKKRKKHQRPQTPPLSWVDKAVYNNEITSLSAISDSIKGYSTAGPSYFTYNGKKVSEIAAETQWKDY